MREKTSPIEPAVEGFVFDFLPFLLSVGSTTSSEKLLRFESRQVNQLIPEENGIRAFEENMINGLFLILALVAIKENR